MKTTKEDRWRRLVVPAVIALMILGPLWGFLVMGACRFLDMGPVTERISFYLMVAGWLIMPVGVLLLLYRFAVGMILNQRRDMGRE